MGATRLLRPTDAWSIMGAQHATAAATRDATAATTVLGASAVGQRGAVRRLLVHRRRTPRTTNRRHNGQRQDRARGRSPPSSAGDRPADSNLRRAAIDCPPLKVTLGLTVSMYLHKIEPIQEMTVFQLTLVIYNPRDEF